MAGTIPIPAVSTLIATLHRHPLPVCKGTSHDKTCRRFKREANCIQIRLDKKTAFADCFHFHIK